MSDSTHACMGYKCCDACGSVYVRVVLVSCVFCFFFQAEDGIRDAQESRGLGDVYKRQSSDRARRIRRSPPRS